MKICRNTFESRIRLSGDSAPELPPLMGNASQLQQVIINLCLNARDAVDGIEKDPSVGVSVRVLDADGVEIPIEPFAAERLVCIRVEDNGMGMDEQTRARIFEPFFTTKAIGKGTGLGLSTAYGIVRAHNGWISCKSTPAAGTTMAVYLPVVEDAAEMSHPAEAAAVLPSGTETILVVDDETAVLNTVSDMLAKSGYSTITETNGHEAIKTFRRLHRNIDMVLLDVDMADMSGPDVLTELRSLEPSSRVVFFTGKDVATLDASSVQAVVQKPVSSSDLAFAIRSVLDG